MECLTLAVANAKSHPISAGGRHETAIQFLTDLEEKLDVAQVQLEIYSTLLPHTSDAPEVEQKVQMLSKQLMTMTEVGCPTLWYSLNSFLPPSCTKDMLLRFSCQPFSSSAFMYPNIGTKVWFDLYGIKFSMKVGLLLSGAHIHQ